MILLGIRRKSTGHRHRIGQREVTPEVQLSWPRYLAAPPAAYAAWEASRTRISSVPPLSVAEVKVEGTRRVNPQALLVQLRDRVGIAPGSPATEEQLAAGARTLHGSGDFERVEVRSHLEHGRRIVVVDVEEKPWGPDYIAEYGALDDTATGSKPDEPRRLRVRMDALDDVPRLVEAIVRAGVAVYGVTPHRRTLEDVFLGAVEGGTE